MNKESSVALCFSGQPRFISQGYLYIFDKIIKVYKPKIFAHVWFDTNDIGKEFDYGNQYNRHEKISRDSIDKIKILYNPIGVEVEKQIKFDVLEYEKKYVSEVYRTPKTLNVISGFYSMKKSNDLKIEYEKNNSSKFDVVIKCRFDERIITFSITDEIIDNTIYGMNVGSGEICDQLFYSSSDTMDEICKLYDNLKTYCSIVPPPRAYSQEAILDYHIKTCGIKKSISNIDTFNIDVLKNICC